MKYKDKEEYNFDDLINIMAILRSENGCPWDKEQTHKSIRNNFIEEVYEAVEAIDEDNPELLKEELGDVLLQVVFHAQMSYENKEFDINGVCDNICKKLIIRHPHIFANVTAETSEQVLSNWENIKIKEKGYISNREYLESVSKSLPALMRAEKIQKRLIKRNIVEKPEIDDLINRLREDFNEIEQSKNSNTNKISEIIGRTLYDIAGLSERLNLNSEQVLHDFNKDVIKNN